MGVTARDHHEDSISNEETNSISEQQDRVGRSKDPWNPSPQPKGDGRWAWRAGSGGGGEGGRYRWEKEELRTRAKQLFEESGKRWLKRMQYIEKEFTEEKTGEKAEEEERGEGGGGESEKDRDMTSPKKKRRIEKGNKERKGERKEGEEGGWRIHEAS